MPPKIDFLAGCTPAERRQLLQDARPPDATIINLKNNRSCPPAPPAPPRLGPPRPPLPGEQRAQYTFDRKGGQSAFKRCYLDYQRRLGRPD